MKKWMKGLICITALAMAFTGCSSASEQNGSSAEDTTQNASEAPEENAAALSGSITMAGSTSMEKLASALNEAFMLAYPDVTAAAQFTGSGAGIEAVTAGTVDIGNSSRALKEEEKEKGVVENIVAIDGIAIVVDKENAVTDITADDLSKIYTGAINNWKDVGGNDQPIVVIGREAGSGTRGAFEEILKVEEQCKYAQEIDSTGAVMAKVAATPGAIGYVSLDVVDDTVAALAIDSVQPTVADIQAGTYPLSRPFVMATKGDISEQNEVVQAMFAFIESEAGQEIIERVGLISVK